jgi:CTP:molybdopterin cytidylyltransferase MocA
LSASDQLAGWTALVLAAGHGRRMGVPKALMTVGGRGWWRVQEERLTRAGVDRLWVVSPQVGAAVHGPAVVESSPDAPMFASVLAGVAARPNASLFILPVDVPAPGPDIWRALAAAAGDRVAVPTFNGEHGHPVALSRLWIDRALKPAGETMRLDHLIAPDTVYIPVHDRAVLVNLNTPDDARAWAAANP